MKSQTVAPAAAAASRAKAEEESLEERTKDYKRLQRQKSRNVGGVEARIILASAFVWGEHYISQTNSGIVPEAPEKNKLHLVFNIINKERNRLMGRLVHNGLQFGAQPNKAGPKAQACAEVADKLLLATDRIVEQPSKTWQLVDWLIKGGVAFEHVCWRPDAKITPLPVKADDGSLMFTDLWTGEELDEKARELALQDQQPPERFELLEVAELAGEVDTEILSPLNVFIDQTVKSITTLAPDQWVYVAAMRTKGWIEANFHDVPGVEEIDYDRELKIVTTALMPEGQVESVASLFLKDLVPTVQGQLDHEDPDAAVVVDGWCPASRKNPRGRWVTFIPGKIMLRDTPNEYPEIPLVDYHFEPVTNTFWTKDFITDQIAPQRFFNKRMSQLGEQSNATMYDNLLLGPGVRASNIPVDQPGPIENGLSDQGTPMVARLGGPQIGGWFLTSIELVLKAAKDIAGGQSLTENEKFPGQLRGPMAVPLMQEILDTEWGPLHTHLATQMARARTMRLNRIKTYYPPSRTLHFVNAEQRDEVMEFHKLDIWGSDLEFEVTVDVSSIMPEMRALRESRIIERLNSPLQVLYLDGRSGALDKSKIAQDLRLGDAARADRESSSRKFCQQLLERLKVGLPIPPVEQFYDHPAMMDELEAWMMTTEFLEMSQPIQDAIRARWSEHMQFVTQAAEQQNQAMQQQQVQSAVAQATQQAAAMAAAQAVDSAMQQMQAQQMTSPGPQELVQAAAQGQRPPAGPQKPPLPPNMGELANGQTS